MIYYTFVPTTSSQSRFGSRNSSGDQSRCAVQYDGSGWVVVLCCYATSDWPITGHATACAPLSTAVLSVRFAPNVFRIVTFLVYNPYAVFDTTAVGQQPHSSPIYPSRVSEVYFN